MVIMVTNRVTSLGVSKTVTRVQRTLTRSHDTTRIKNHGVEIRSPSNKESKPKDICITVTKDVKYFCPTGYDKGIYNAVTKLLHEKVEQAKRSGTNNDKTVNTVE